MLIAASQKRPETRVSVYECSSSSLFLRKKLTHVPAGQLPLPRTSKRKCTCTNSLDDTRQLGFGSSFSFHFWQLCLPPKNRSQKESYRRLLFHSVCQHEYMSLKFLKGSIVQYAGYIGIFHCLCLTHSLLTWHTKIKFNTLCKRIL